MQMKHSGFSKIMQIRRIRLIYSDLIVSFKQEECQRIIYFYKIIRLSMCDHPVFIR